MFKRRQNKIKVEWPTVLPSSEWKYPHRYQNDLFSSHDRILRVQGGKGDDDAIRKFFLQRYPRLFAIGDVAYMKTWFVIAGGGTHGTDHWEHNGYCSVMVRNAYVDMEPCFFGEVEVSYSYDVVLLDKNMKEIENSLVEKVKEYNLHSKREMEITLERKMLIQNEKLAKQDMIDRKEEERKRIDGIIENNKVASF